MLLSYFPTCYNDLFQKERSASYIPRVRFEKSDILRQPARAEQENEDIAS